MVKGKKKSQFLKGFGKTIEIVKAIFNAVLALGGDDSDLERVLKDPELVKQIAELIVGAKKTITEALVAFVDYIAPSYAELKTQFDWVNDWFEKVNFETIEACETVSREPRDVAFEIIHFSRGISTADALVELDKQGLRPAIYEELLAFAKAHPNEQRKYLIIALGSVCGHPVGDRSVACLGGRSAARSLDSDWIEGVWGGRCRFLAVRK